MDKIKKLLRSPFFYVIIILAILRIFFGSKVGIYYPSTQGADDHLLARYSMMISHFTMPDFYSMVKTMGYPVFVDAIYFLHIKYSIAVSLIWVIDALFVGYIIYKLSNKKWLSLFAYLYTLFMPMAFELFIGTRMYRNSVIAPLSLFVFCILLRKVYSLKNNIKISHEVFFTIMLSLAFPLTYYLKEDGIWILGCLLLAILLELIYLIIKAKKKNISIKKCIILIILSIMPFIVFEIVTIAYKEVNYKFFGVREIETKSGGELGKFVSNVYKIESKDRTSVIWAPNDAIEKAFEASPTLKEHEDLKQEVLCSQWTDYNCEQPIYGDFLTWVMRSALVNTNLWENEKQVNDMFKQVNKELDEAFKNGKLKKEDRIQLLSSAGGKTPKEIWNLRGIIFASYRNTIFLTDYQTGIKDSEQDYMWTVEHYAKVTRETYIVGNTRNKKELKVYSKIIEVIFWIYRIVNPVLFFALTINFIIGLVKFILSIKNKVMKLDIIKYLIILCFFMISFAYTFGISWFTEFLHRYGINNSWQNYYCVALPILLIFPYLLSVDMICDYIKELKNKKKGNRMKKEDKLEKVFNKCLEIFHIKLKEKNKKLLLQIFKFVIVGGTAFIIDYVTLIICKEVFHLNTLLAAAIAFTVSTVVNYILSVKWVFDVNDKHSGKRNFIIFIIFSLMGLGLTELIMWIGEDLLHISYLIVKIIATAIVMVFNFVTRKIFLEK